MSTSLLEALSLPELASEHAPQFTTPATCKVWIKAQPITNTPQAQLRLRYQLESFNRYALPGDPTAALRMDMLDQLRVPVLFVQAECARRFTKQKLPLPLPEAERIAFASERALWLALGTGYLQVLRVLLERSQGTSLNETERNIAARAARCAMSAARSDYLFHLHAGLLPDAGFWHRLHQMQRLAETLEISQCSVGDKSSASAVYVEVLLLSRVALYRLTSKQVEQVAYWAQRWASRVPLLSLAPADRRTPSIVVDVLGGGSPVYASAETTGSTDASCRWLDLRNLRKTIKQRLLKLSEGAMPHELHLGGICAQPECGAMLEQVYRDWCKGGSPSRAKTPEKSYEHCEWVIGVEAIYHQLGGAPLQLLRASTKEAASPYQTRRSYEEIAVLGDVIRHGIEIAEAAHEPTHGVEHGQVIDENLDEIFLQRSLDVQNVPLRAEQLVLVRLKRSQIQPIAIDEASAWQLARIRWVVMDLDGACLRVGIHLFPGVPRAVQIFVPAHAEAKAQTIPGLALPAVPSLDQPASLLLPQAGLGISISIGSVMEIRNPAGAVSTSRVRLIRLICRMERGADFERWTYEEMA